MSDRAKLLDWLRSDILGPHTPPSNPCAEDILFEGNILDTNIVLSNSIRFHTVSGDVEEILQFGRETPKARYGVGVLYPPSENENKDQETKKDQNLKEEESEGTEDDAVGDGEGEEEISGMPDAEQDDYSITSENPFRPNQMGISFYVKNNCTLQIRFPKTRKVSWKKDEEKVNGRYVGNSKVQTADGFEKQIYARFPVGNNESFYCYQCEIDNKGNIPIEITGEVSWLKFKVYCRKYDGNILVTVILANEATDLDMKYHLFQSFFCVKALNDTGENMLLPYPGLEKISVRKDIEEDQLRLLYSNFENWGIGHGCSCGWDAQPGETPEQIFADVMAAVETPSMDTNVEVDGAPITVSMKKLADIDVNDDQLIKLLKGYKSWIDSKTTNGLDNDLKEAAEKHLENCNSALNRMTKGLEILQTNPKARLAFRLANQSICLQQISTKKLKSRKLVYNTKTEQVEVESVDNFLYAHDIFGSKDFANQTSIGYWRPFQIAFFLMSLEGITNPESADRKVVDLIWFPTGGGKTEAYLGVAAFTMFYERLIGQNSGDEDDNTKFGTNVFMRYTLRLLTTQQVQRAASMFCAMEYIRRNSITFVNDGEPISRQGKFLLGNRAFVLGLWAGKGVSPNSLTDARISIKKYRDRDNQKNNPLSLYRCPYCYAQIGVYNHEGNNNPPLKYQNAQNNRQKNWNVESAKGPVDYKNGWWNRCPDFNCIFGGSSVIPLQVVDESLYKDPPSMFIATVDKFAQLAVKKEAASFFKIPPSLIIQDELHLISGPLGSLYGLYETLVEKLCSNGNVVPKIICSTATIKGAHRQVKNLYGRNNLQLFPPPALEIEDSFFGRYAKRKDGSLDQGRLYVGINAHYSSALTTHVRVFSRIHQGSRHLFNDSKNLELMDQYYTLVCFYNSIRELSGGKTIFDSDIKSRITSHLNSRDNTRDTVKPPSKYPELTGRLSQNKLLQSLENLEKPYKETQNEALDACLASSVIEVGVDIDRLALMAVVGQPKTTAQYIQVTGRVGRNWKKVPGLVLTLFSPSKPRDISHYEQFHSYHRRLYEYVEPTSVTPFSEATLERSLAAILFGWLIQNDKWDRDPNNKNCTNSWNEAKQFVIDKGKILGITNLQDIVGKLEATFKKIWSWKNDNRDRMYLHSWKWKADDDFILFPYGEHAEGSEQNLIRFMSSLRSVDLSGMAKIQIFDHDLGNLNNPV